MTSAACVAPQHPNSTVLAIPSFFRSERNVRPPRLRSLVTGSDLAQIGLQTEEEREREEKLRIEGDLSFDRFRRMGLVTADVRAAPVSSRVSPPRRRRPALIIARQRENGAEERALSGAENASVSFATQRRSGRS